MDAIIIFDYRFGEFESHNLAMAICIASGGGKSCVGVRIQAMPESCMMYGLTGFVLDSPCVCVCVKTPSDNLL